MICMSMNENVRRREEKRRIGHLPYSYESVQDERCSEEALRKLSRSIEEVRLHSQHRQNMCVCICAACSFVRSHSFLFLFYIDTKETSCLRIESNHFPFLFFSLLILLIGLEENIFLLVNSERKKKSESEEERESCILIMDCKSTIHIGDN
jgi:hypothetical protein